MFFVNNPVQYHSPYNKYHGDKVKLKSKVLKGGEVFLIVVEAQDGNEFHVTPWELISD
jgi:hypothetical protein